MPANMTWREMWEALECLGDVTLNRGFGGKFYLNVEGIEVKEHDGDGVLVSGCDHMAELEDAVAAAWKKYVTDLPADGYLVKNAGRPDRQHFRWNGFMWKELDVPKREVDYAS